MFKTLVSEMRSACVMLLVMTVLTGIVYPLVVTASGMAFFPRQASGSFIMKGDQTVGSELIGQPFSDAKYFWSRPSATSPYPYKADASSGSNLGPTNKILIDAVNARVKTLREGGIEGSAKVPVDLVTTSASGLDPHISPAAAEIQVVRVARARTLSEEQIRKLVAQFTEDRQWGMMGEPRVNVLRLNLALDDAAKVKP